MSIATPAEIGLRLYRLRAERGWSGPLVADKVEVTRATYCYWESGQRRITLAHAMRIAEVYGMSAEEIFGEKQAF